MSVLDEKRLLTKIATLYYVENLKQTDIAKKLSLSQSFVSRSLAKCISDGIVKISIIPPANTFLELERQIQSKYNISQAIVVDVNHEDDDLKIKSMIGSAAAYYLQVTLQPDTLVGISAWSSTIKAMLETLLPLNIKAKAVVQLLGGVGINGNLQANFLTYELANKLNCPSYLLPAQSFSRNGDVNYKEELLNTPEVSKVQELFTQIDLAIVGIGMLEPSQLLKNSGLFYDKEMLSLLAGKGAVGDICLHYFDQNGVPVLSQEEDPVLGMDLQLIKNCPRVVALAGGKEKVNAIRGALNGGYIDVLIIDKISAQYIVQD
ncbi:MAG TPA: DNA-binding transcriptional regulator [Pasteurellaceae bacterium]|nr:DNA-binding transcriptional regulator [Pasteurellaceae bacterium]